MTAVFKHHTRFAGRQVEILNDQNFI